MLTEFSFDENFFNSSHLNDEGLSAVHDTIISSWRNFGVLVLPRNKATYYLEKIKGLPPKFHQRWMDAMTINKVVVRDEDWGGLAQYESILAASALIAYFKTGLVEDELGIILSDQAEAKSFCPKSGFEVVGAGIFTESINFAESRNESVSEIEANHALTEVWTKKFSGLVKNTKSITILDRYMFQRQFEGGTYDRASIREFVRLLSSSGGKFSLRLISGGGVKGSQEHLEAVNFVRKFIWEIPPLRKCISALTLVSNSDDFFRDYCHERFIKFDSHVCQIGVGMNLFERRSTPMTEFSVKHESDSKFSERERRSQKELLWREDFI